MIDILIIAVILFGAYYIGYRKGESDTHRYRNRISDAFKRLDNK